MKSWPFIIINCTSLSSATIFVLKSIFSGIGLATLACFWLLFSCNIFFQLLLLPYLCLWVKCESFVDNISIYHADSRLWIRDFNLLTFNVIADKVGFWVNSGSWWWTGRPGVLQFTGSQRVRHDWVTELNWRIFICQLLFIFYKSYKFFFLSSSTIASFYVKW